ncbi:MAG: 3'(2'),5'-bisphosphate nucleotidase CysQ [Gammaproteobacteria bacterium]|jgi:3'(2'), 5'-bisphosphate nucleotidase
MSSTDPALLKPLAEISEAAGREILKIYETDFDVETKGDDSPLTAADTAAHHLICERLAALTPDLPILSEESSDIPFEQRRRWDTYWLVDPLDGTREFIKRNGEFTVNIALIQDHRPVAGVVHVPALGFSYMGCQGVGAMRQEAGRAAHPIHVEVPARNPLRVVASRSHRNAETEAVLERMGAHELVPKGSSLKFCLVAEGGADFYPRLGPTSEWDTAAAQAVVEAAGGQVCTLDMQPLEYNRKESLLNPWFVVFGDAAHDWAAYLPPAN